MYHDDSPAMQVAQAIIAVILSRLVIAAIAGVLVNGGLDAMISGAEIVSSAVLQAQQEAEFARLQDERASQEGRLTGHRGE